MNVEELEATPYRETGETYGEYIGRLERIIYNWHDTHTTMLFNLREQLKKIPQQFIEEAYYVFNRGTKDHKVWDFEEWFKELNNLVDTKQ